MSGDAVDFTILTGYLGAGKTTVLNRILAAPLGRRIAVLVNELGRIAIDGSLIVARGGDVLELAGGCVCCTIDVKNDLWDGIADVVRRSSPDHVVLETTGIAEPSAIFEGLGRLPAALVDRLVPAGVICVVDGEAGAEALDRREEARQQVACADRIILSKLDRAGPDAVVEIHRRLDRLGPAAERASFSDGEAADRALSSYVLERRTPSGEGRDRRGAHGHAHGHGQLAAVCLVEDAPLVADLVLAVIEAWRPRLHRVKGWVRLAGEAAPAFLELAGASLSLTRGRPARSGGTELVLIGEDLDEGALRRQLAACRVATPS